jgi:hypothetical protein
MIDTDSREAIEDEMPRLGEEMRWWRDLAHDPNFHRPFLYQREVNRLKAELRRLGKYWLEARRT